MSSRRPNRRHRVTPAIFGGHRLRLALLLGLSIAAYWPALRAGYIWDDSALTDNKLITRPGGLLNIWLKPSLNLQEQHYWPMVYTTFWFEHKLWGLRPAGYHAVNLLLHLANALLLWKILERSRVRPTAAWLGAMIFALHPVHVESVAWVIERKDVLSGLFYLAAFLGFIRFIESSDKRFYAACAGFLLLAMLSKSIAISLPVSLFLWMVWRGKVNDRRILWLAPLALLALTIGLLDARHALSVAPYRTNFGIVERACVAGRAFMFYVGRFLWPSYYLTLYPKWNAPVSTMSLAALGAASGLVAAGTFLWLKRRGGAVLLSTVCFGLTLAPILGVVDFGFMEFTYVTDRYQYLASAALCIPAAVFISWLGDLRNRARLNPRRALPVLLMLLMSAWTFSHSRAFKDMETIFLDNIAKNPGSWPAWYNTAIILGDRGEYAKAVEHYEKVVELAPEFEMGWNNLGLARLKVNREADAVFAFEQARLLDPHDASPLNNLGLLELNKGNLDAAREMFEAAVAADPDSAAARNNMGTILIRQYELLKAIEHLQMALVINPDYADALANLGQAYNKMGRRDEAVEVMDRVLQSPNATNAPLFSAAQVFAERGRMEQALEVAARMLENNPNDPDALNMLGIFAGQQKRFDEAEQYFQRALAVRPDHPEVLNNLAKLHELQASPPPGAGPPAP